jgi:hypothetical protein
LITSGHWLALALYMGLTGLAVGALWPDLRAIVVVVLISIGLSTYQVRGLRAEAVAIGIRNNLLPS